MPRKAKGIHSSPENAGAENFPEGYAERKKDDLCTMEKILPMYKKGAQYLHDYKGLWTDEQFEKAVYDYFEYCCENEVKPDKSGLQLWLGVSTSQYYDWTTKPEKYGSKSEILDRAHLTMKTSYTQRGEKYPTFNMFLLKAGHGMVETNKVEITNNSNANPDELKDTISKLGLDKED